MINTLLIVVILVYILYLGSRISVALNETQSHKDNARQKLLNHDEGAFQLLKEGHDQMASEYDICLKQLDSSEKENKKLTDTLAIVSESLKFNLPQDDTYNPHKYSIEELKTKYSDMGTMFPERKSDKLIIFTFLNWIQIYEDSKEPDNAEK